VAPTIISRVVIPATAQFAGGQALDLIDLADVKQELGITTNVNDAWLGKVITRASRAISQACTRVFQPQTYHEYFQALRDPYPWQLPSGFFPLQLSAWPLCSPPSLAGTAPPLAPTLSSTSGGSLAAATYYVRVSFVTATGETAASLEARLSVAGNNLLVVATPQAGSPNFTQGATGWNCYVGTASYQETLQNSSPIALDENFTLPTDGLVTGAAVPNYILVVENNPLDPQPLTEGIDFRSDYNGVNGAIGSPDFSVGWLTRLFLIDETPRRWAGLPITVVYQAGYPDIPDDLEDAALQLVKARYFARNRDPLLRTENIPGAYEATWFFDTGPGSNGQFPPSVEAIIDRYRVPVLA
jgi:hypothetical protein